MAVGKQSVTIDSDELANGSTTSDNFLDGGFSIYSEGVNLVANPGVVYASPEKVSLGTLDGTVVTACFDTYSSNTFAPDKWLSTNNGSLYLLNGGVLTNVGTIGSSTTLVPGVSDSLQYDFSATNPVIYITKTNDISRVVWNVAGSSATITTNWGTTVAGSPGSFTTNPHPLLNFNKVMFIGDGNKLHTWDGTTFTSSVLTLKVGEVITALSIDPGSGRMLIGVSSRGFVTSSGDFTTTRPSQAFIGLYDGVNPTQFQRKIPVDDVVKTFANSSGVTYVIYGDNIGIFNGSGIQFLRKLYTNQGVPSTDVSINTYKQKVCSIQNFIFVVSRQVPQNPWLSNRSDLVIGYGDVGRSESMANKKSFFNVLSDSTGFSSFDFISNYRDTGILYSRSESGGAIKLYYVPILDGSVNKSTVLSTGDSSPVFVSKVIAFPRPSQVTQVRIFFEDTVTGNGSVIGNLGVIDDNLISMYSTDISNASGADNMKWFDIFPDTNQTTQIQLKYQWKETSTNHGIQKLMVFFTPYE